MYCIDFLTKQTNYWINQELNLMPALQYQQWTTAMECYEN